MATTNSKELFESISKSIRKTADRAAKKTDEFIAAQKVKNQIYGLESQIDTDFATIGEIIYGNHVAGEEYDADVTDLCLEVTLLRKEIVELREQLSGIKGVNVCASCGGDIPDGARFCMFCGEPTPDEDEVEEEASEEVVEEAAEETEEAAEEAAEPAEEAEEAAAAESAEAVEEPAEETEE